MADWAEVHRLAADFQRLQASSTAHKLSERNCVELVTKLVQRGLLEIVHTLDGKEYVTPGQLDREIRDELAAHGGDVAYRSYDEYSNIVYEVAIDPVIGQPHSLRDYVITATAGWSKGGTGNEEMGNEIRNGHSAFESEFAA